MQFILGILILRTKVGFDVFNWLGIQIQVSYWTKTFTFYIIFGLETLT